MSPGQPVEMIARRAVPRPDGRAAVKSGRSEIARLTARELQVLELMALGFTNLRIANALFLSDRTVEVHVGRIFDKLLIGRSENSNRRVLAVLAYLGTARDGELLDSAS